MSLNVNNVEIENVIVKNKTTGEQTELEEMYCDGELVWEKKDEFILTVRPASNGWNCIQFTCTIKDSPCVVSCETKEDEIIDESNNGNAENASFHFTEDELDKFYKVTFSGNFTGIVCNYESGSGSPTLEMCIDEIIKWPRGSKLYNRLFYFTPFNGKDIVIPDHITDLSTAFSADTGFGVGYSWSESYVRTKLILHDHIVSMGAINRPVSNGAVDIGNAVVIEKSIYIDDYLIGRDFNANSYTLPSDCRFLPTHLCTKADYHGLNGFRDTFLSEINFPQTATWDTLPSNFAYYNEAIKTITIPSYVKKIEGAAFAECSNLAEIRFNHSNSDPITIVDGVFNVKTARSMSVYTDNESIKNYNWSGDNITATLYHLDGTAWEV